MNSENRDRDISPVGIDPEIIIRKTQMSAVSSPPMTNREIAARTVTIRTVDTWNMNPAISSPGRPSCKDKSAANMPPTDKDDDILMETEYLRTANVEMQCMI